MSIWSKCDAWVQRWTGQGKWNPKIPRWLVLLIALAGVLLLVWSNHEAEKRWRTTVMLMILMSDCRRYYEAHQAMPAAENWVEDLASLEGVDVSDISLLDGWDRPMHYRLLEDGSAEFRSAGWDGALGNDDDQVSRLPVPEGD